MTDKTNQSNVAEAQLDAVMNTFESELDKLIKRQEGIVNDTKGAFLEANRVLDHADHVNDRLKAKVNRLASFFGPPPNSLGVEEAKMIEQKEPT